MLELGQPSLIGGDGFSWSVLHRGDVAEQFAPPPTCLRRRVAVASSRDLRCMTQARLLAKPKSLLALRLGTLQPNILCSRLVAHIALLATK